MTGPLLPRTLGARLTLIQALLGACLVACNSGGGGGVGGASFQAGGFPATKADGSSFFVDDNYGGGANRLHLVEMFWGRIVDVHDIDAVTGSVKAQPQFRDYLISENIQTNGQTYRLEVNPITQTTRLVILVDRDADEARFIALVENAATNLPPIAPKSDDGTSQAPFSFMARNATLALVFDDALQDDAAAASRLPSSVRVLTGYPPSQPFTARMRFDPNHGALIGDTFHSTRVLIDMTVSEAELSGMAFSAPLNSLGLPASLVTTGQPNVTVRIPSREDLLSGQFAILRGLGGAPMDARDNGPTRNDLPTADVTRALRAGNADDVNNGFQLDLKPPELVGGFPLSIESASVDPSGPPGLAFVLARIVYTTVICGVQPEPGDIINVGGNFLEVRSTAGQPDLDGVVTDVRVQVLGGSTVSNPNDLLGGATYLSTLDTSAGLPAGCWVSFAPQPAEYPATGVPPSAQILLRFSEPMDPARMQPFDSFQLFLDAASVDAEPSVSTVVGSIKAAGDLRDFSYTPQLPLQNAHVTSANRYHLELGAVTDLAGNGLITALPDVDFTVDPNVPTLTNGSIVLRFDGVDEYKLTSTLGTADGKTDLRGQFFFDLERGIIRPRPVTHYAAIADRNNPVPGQMIPFPRGLQTPLSPLGSKMQQVWRYADMGWLVDDETRYNLDVEGISWSPSGGQVIADFYEKFEIRLSHSVRLPDEYVDSGLLPRHSGSGVLNDRDPYTANILGGSDQQVVVHNRALGYELNPIDVFATAQGTPMMPYPWNRVGGEHSTYTWRDTSNTRVGGPQGAGIPMDVEVLPPLALYGDPTDPNLPVGSLGGTDKVPTVGLPLLMEYRCFPSDTGFGLNALDVSLAINSSAQPNFRNFSTGGINQNGNRVLKDPDLELNPSGGFNPGNGNRPTARSADNTFYVGQLDIVVRISRVHTVWLDSLLDDPDWVQPVLEPTSDQQPLGTQVICAFRGARTFSNNALNKDAVFNAENIDPYGSPSFGSVTFAPGGPNDGSFKASIDLVDGARLLQLRFSFLSNLDSGLAPELSAIGIAFIAP